jgi:hypothetical protein
MSWYFLGGFSAYWIVPSGRARNHSGCSLTHGWSGDAWKAMSSATSMLRWRGGLDQPIELAVVAEVRVDRRVAAVAHGTPPIAHGTPEMGGR